MKKIYILMLLLSATILASAQKITITTSDGQKVEIACDKMLPAEIKIEGNKVVLKMDTAQVKIPEVEANADSVVVPVKYAPELAENADSTVVSVEDASCLTENTDSLSSGNASVAGFVANSLAEELFPEYAKFNQEHLGEKMTQEDLVKKIAKDLGGQDAVETVDFFGKVFGGLRFTKDTTFVAQYEQRKPKKSWRTYDIVSLDGSFGKDFESVAPGEYDIDEDDYGDDTKNENKWGGGLNYSRVYISGTVDSSGQWVPNPVGLAFSWGGLVAYSYEKDMGSNFSVMGKVGAQIGHDVTIGVDALFGGGITPYNIFLTNGINHSLVKRSVLCFKYGIQAWGSLNFSRNTYTALFGRYIISATPSSGNVVLPQGWKIVLEDFNPSSWTVGLAVGYKFGEIKPLSQDKRLQVTFLTGYNFVGNKGLILSTEIERFTKVSPSTSLAFGLTAEELFRRRNGENERCVSVMLSAGFKVQQPDTRWFWGAKLYGGVGDHVIGFSGQRYGTQICDYIKKICGRVDLQLSTGYNFGKCNEVFTAIRAGYYFTKPIETDGFDNVTYIDTKGLSMSAHMGYRFTF